MAACRTVRRTVARAATRVQLRVGQRRRSRWAYFGRSGMSFFSPDAIIFDDSLEHWVAFDAEPTAQRIVLVVDVPHPDLRGTTNR